MPTPSRDLKSYFAALTLAVFLAPPSRAASFSVSNSSGSTAGSLQQAILDSNAAGGANTIGWTAATGGALNLTSPLQAINDGTTVSVSVASSAVTISGPYNLTVGGAVTLDNASATQPWTVAAVVDGAGSLIKTGAGTLALTGGNTYSGGTTINAGIVNINSASSLGSGALIFNGGTLQTASTVTFANAITLNAGGGTIDTLGNASTLSGVISGVGSLTNASTATLILTGVNTYQGGTILNAGLLQISQDSALGAGAVTFNGGALQFAANYAAARAMTLAGAGTVDTNGYDAALSGVIGGAGALTKTGLGTLTLSGANTYGGGTTVNAGVLALGANNALGTGGLTVASGGTLAMSGFTQAAASFSGPGTTRLTLQPGVTNMTVAGNANLTGGTLVLAPPANQLLAAGQTYKPFTFGSNAGSTQFATIVSPAAFSFTPTYNAGDLTLTAVAVPFARVAATANQSEIGGSLEAMRSAPAGDQATVLGSLYAMDAAHLQAALDLIGPISLASMQGVGLAASGVQAASVGQRMNALADGSGHGGYANYSVSGRSSYPGVLVAAAGAGDEAGAWAPRDSGTGSPWGFFTSGAVTTGKLAEASGPSGLQPGYVFNSGGLTAGADYRFDEHFTAGGTLGYLRGHASINQDGGGTVDDDSARYGVYAVAVAGDFHAKGSVGGAADFFKTARGISFGGISRTAAARPTGNEFNSSVSADYDLRTSRWGIFTPFAGLDYDRLMIGRFTESGAGALNLDVAPQTAQSLRSNVGLKYSQKLATDAHTYLPYVRLGWRHELDNQSRPITAQFATGVGSPFTVSTGDTARDGTILGTGISMDLGRQTTARLDYTGDFRSHFRESVVNAGVRYAF